MADKDKPQVMAVNDAQAVSYSISLAMGEALKAGKIDLKTLEWISDRSNELFKALMQGKVLDARTDGTISIVEPEKIAEEMAVLDAADEGLVI